MSYAKLALKFKGKLLSISLKIEIGKWTAESRVESQPPDPCKLISVLIERPERRPFLSLRGHEGRLALLKISRFKCEREEATILLSRERKDSNCATEEWIENSTPRTSSKEFCSESISTYLPVKLLTVEIEERARKKRLSMTRDCRPLKKLYAIYYLSYLMSTASINFLL